MKTWSPEAPERKQTITLGETVVLLHLFQNAGFALIIRATRFFYFMSYNCFGMLVMHGFFLNTSV